jgi:hypothetical protein
LNFARDARVFLFDSLERRFDMRVRKIILRSSDRVTLSAVAIIVCSVIVGGGCRAREVKSPPGDGFVGAGDAVRSEALQPTTDAPLADGQSAVWCATMQMAWDKLTALNDRPLLIASADPQAAAISAGHFHEDWIDRGSVTVTAGVLSAEDTQRVREVAERFGGEPTLPGDPKDAPRAMPTATAFAMLSKALTFEHPFRVRESGIEFDSGGAGGPQEVAAFVARRGDDPATKKIVDQVDVLWCTPPAEDGRAREAEVVVEMKRRRTTTG